jgi:hypothetical protein
MACWIRRTVFAVVWAALVAAQPVAAMSPPSCSDPMPSGGQTLTPIVGAPPIRIDLADGRFCESDCLATNDASFKAEGIVVSDGLETLAGGGLLSTRLAYNPRLRVFALYQSLTRTHQATRDTLILIDCRVAGNQ